MTDIKTPNKFKTIKTQSKRTMPTGRSSEKALEAKTARMIAAGRQRSVKLRFDFNPLMDPAMFDSDMKIVITITINWMRKFPSLYE